MRRSRARGGGIASTVAATRALDEAGLIATALPRLDALIAEGATTVEIKSGYGLSLQHERLTLQAARRLGELRPVSIRTTFLGAHALPLEFAGQADAYIDLICREMIPALAAEGLIDAVDAFCEGIGFTSAQTRRVFETARRTAYPSSFMPSSCRTSTARRSPPNSGHCRPTISNIWMTRG